ncbi:MAG: DUF1353 domain-containing protein [Pseudomonadota bacterium]
MRKRIGLGATIALFGSAALASGHGQPAEDAVLVLPAPKSGLNDWSDLPVVEAEELEPLVPAMDQAALDVLSGLDRIEYKRLFAAYRRLTIGIAAWEGRDVDHGETTSCGAKPDLDNKNDRSCMIGLIFPVHQVPAIGALDTRGLFVMTFRDGALGSDAPADRRARLDAAALSRTRSALAAGIEPGPFPYVLAAFKDPNDRWVFAAVNVLNQQGNEPARASLEQRIEDRRRAEAEAAQGLEVQRNFNRAAQVVKTASSRRAATLSRDELRAWSAAYRGLLNPSGKMPDGSTSPCGVPRALPTRFNRICMLERTAFLYDLPDEGITFSSDAVNVEMTIDGETITLREELGPFLSRGAVKPAPGTEEVSVVLVRDAKGIALFEPGTLVREVFEGGVAKLTKPVEEIVEGLGDLYSDLEDNFGIQLARRDGQRLNFIVEEDILYCRRKTGDLLLVPAGFVTDLASVSNWLRTLMMVEQSPKEFPGAILHDWLYAISRPENGDDHVYSDTLFREELEDAGANWMTRRFFPLGTRIGGRSAVGRPSEMRFATLESCARGTAFRGGAEMATVGRIGEDLEPGDKCEGFLDRYDALLAEFGQTEPLDTALIIDNEERARYFEAVVGNEDESQSCPLPADE